MLNINTLQKVQVSPNPLADNCFVDYFVWSARKESRLATIQSRLLLQCDMYFLVQKNKTRLVKHTLYCWAYAISRGRALRKSKARPQEVTTCSVVQKVHSHSVYVCFIVCHLQRFSSSSNTNNSINIQSNMPILRCLSVSYYFLLVFSLFKYCFTSK